VAVDKSKVPASALCRTIAVSSEAERAEDNCSKGSTPKARTTWLDSPFKTVITGLNRTVKARCMGVTTRATSNGLANAKFLGNSSPNTIEKALTSIRATTTAMAVAREAASFMSCNNCANKEVSAVCVV